jgi:hypothetical protein
MNESGLRNVTDVMGYENVAIVASSSAAWKTYCLKGFDELVPIGSIIGGLEVVAIASKPDPEVLMFMRECCDDLRAGKATPEQVREILQ